MAAASISSSATISIFSPPIYSNSRPQSSKPQLNSFWNYASIAPIRLNLSYFCCSLNRFAVINVLKLTGKASSTVDVQDLAESYSKPTILVSEKVGEAGLEVLRGFGNVECLYNLSPEQLCEKISSCDALIVRSGTKVTRQVFEAAKGRLKVVGRAGVGIDNVDLQAATEYGCLVVNAPTTNTMATAEHGIALLTAMARNVAQADASMKAGSFHLLHSTIFWKGLDFFGD